MLSTAADATLNFVFEGVRLVGPAEQSHFLTALNSTAHFMPVYPGVPASVSSSHRHPVPSMFSFAVAPMADKSTQPVWPATLTMSMFSAPSASDDLLTPTKLALHGLFRETMRRIPISSSWLAAVQPYADAYGGNVRWAFVPSHAELRFTGLPLTAWLRRVHEWLSQYKSSHEVLDHPLPLGYHLASQAAKRSTQNEHGEILCTVADAVDMVAYAAAKLIRGAAAYACRCASFDVVLRPAVPVVGVDARGGYSAASEALERCHFGCPPRDLVTVPQLRCSYAEDGTATWSFDQPWAVKSMFNVTWTAVETQSHPTGWKALV